MEKIRDFFYNISDIILSLIIVILMGLIFYKNLSVFFSKGEILPDISSIYSNVMGDESKKSETKSFSVADEQMKNDSSSKDEPVDISDDEKQELLAKNNSSIPSSSTTIKDEVNSSNSKNDQVEKIEENKNISQDVKKENKPITQDVKKENKPITQDVKKENNPITQEVKKENKPIAQDVKKENKNQSTTKKANSSSLTVTIPDMTTTDKVVDILVSNGVVNSKDEFLDYLIDNKLDSKIKSGDFKLDKSMDYNEISKVICK